MPEIKNTFTGGKMNKDLDERLVSPGEYRDALNVGIGRSEGADIGALENLLGNKEIGPGATASRVVTRTIPGEPGELIPAHFEITTGSLAYGVVRSVSPTSFVITATGGNIESDNSVRGLIGPLVSTNLPDDVNEQSSANLVSVVRIGSTNEFTVTISEAVNPAFTSGSVLRNYTYVSGATTVGTPDRVVTETISGGALGTCIGSIRDQNSDKIYWFTTGDSFDAVWEYCQQQDQISILLRGDLNFSTDNLITGVNVIEGLLYWTDDRNEPRKLDIKKWREEADNNVTPTSIYGRSFQERDITVIRPHPTEGIEVEKSIDVDSDNPPFEEVFPQFAYRWKYDDGEYSPYSSFTEEVFTPAPYDATEHYKEGYNKAVRNIVSSVRLSNIPKGGPDVVEVDVLYTESITGTVYTLLTVTSEDEDNWGEGDYIEDQTINKRSFYAALPTNQLSRRFDEVPRLAKAQEVTANRLIYGNFLRNYPQPKLVDIITSQRSHDQQGISVKGNRDYEVGVTYIDQFGRQGNLLNSGDVYTSHFSTSRAQQLSARINSDAPDWATHYKYWVKEPSMDHHNLVAYNTFNDGEADKNNSEFVWLQFASDDRNKISQDTFLVPRRHTHGELVTTGSNTLGADYTIDSTNPFNMNHGARGAVRRGRERIIWNGNEGVTHSTSTASALSGGGVYTAPVDGTYNFAFSGELHFESRDRRRWAGRAFIDIGVAFQTDSGGGFPTDKTVVSSTLERLPRINAPGRPKVTPFSINYSVDLNAGQRVRPVIRREKNRDRGAVRFSLNQASFRTLTTPVDPNLAAPPVELPGICIPEFSRHKVIDIENEAPDIVRNQLPVELRKLGPTIEYGHERRGWLLTNEFNADEDGAGDDTEAGNLRAEWEALYTENSTELYYMSGDEVHGFLNDSVFSALNIILDRNGLDRLRINEGIPVSDIDPGDQTIVVDVSEVEGGLYLGVGVDNTVAETGIPGKVRINEIAVGFDDNDDSTERSIVRFTLDGPIGVNPANQELAVFSGRITDNALKNLQGSFFVKVPRATNNNTLPFIPTGQSVFDDENNVQTLQSIWFETLPVEDNPEVNIYWEASESIPIANHGNTDLLDFYNCIALTDDCVFIETQRIYDRFNSVQIAKGIKANIPIENYSEERRQASLIHSGIFNSRTGVNRLNQFIWADRIWKDLEPNYGTIQKLHTRDTDLIVFCEDKVFKILADKDLLFNADGGGNVSASNAVLGQTTPYIGEYGISKNPESFATYGSRIYFTDKARGVVMRLSQNGLEEISSNGMSDYFRDGLREVTGALWGSYDDYHNLYNIVTGDSLASFDDYTKGWPSRKSFVPESGLTLNNLYYTFKDGTIWVHNSTEVPRNNFYGTQYCSSVTTIFNQDPSVIKNFKTLNYEGTGGWTAPLIITDQEAGKIDRFFNKEGKWFECVGSLRDSEIIPIITELGDDGIEDFYDEDNIDDGLFGDEYDFDNNDDTDYSEDTLEDLGDTGGGGMGDGGPMGLGEPVDVRDGDNNDVHDDDYTDEDPPDNVTITFEIIPEE